MLFILTFIFKHFYVSHLYYLYLSVFYISIQIFTIFLLFLKKEDNIDMQEMQCHEHVLWFDMLQKKTLCNLMQAVFRAWLWGSDWIITAMIL